LLKWIKGKCQNHRYISKPRVICHNPAKKWKSNGLWYGVLQSSYPSQEVSFMLSYNSKTYLKNIAFPELYNYLFLTRYFVTQDIFSIEGSSSNMKGFHCVCFIANCIHYFPD